MMEIKKGQEGFNELYAAGMLIKLTGKNEMRDYVRYLIVKEGKAYCTDTRLLLVFPTTLIDGVYNFERKTKSLISLIKLDIEVELPGYKNVLNKGDKYPFEFDFGLDNFEEALLYQLYDVSGGMFRLCYIKVVKEFFGRCMGFCGGKKDSIIFEKEGKKAVLMPFIGRE